MTNYRRYSPYRSRRPVSGPRRMNRILLVLIGAVILFFAGRALLSGPQKSEGNANANTNASLSLGNLNLNVSLSSKRADPAACDEPISVATTTKNEVALTFDTINVTTGTSSILETLKAQGIPAAFFVTGDWATKNTDLLKTIAASFPVYSRGQSLVDLTTLESAKLEAQITNADLAIREITGKTTKPFFRPPYGALDKDGNIVKQLQTDGYCAILWTVDGLDWQETATADSVTARVLERGAKPGAIILLHAGDEISAGAVSKIIEGLKGKGFTFVSLESLLSS